MVREGDLWDDSALVNAFDDAMFKYKKMHKKINGKCSAGGSNVECSTQENANVVADESYGAVGWAEKDAAVASNPKPMNMETKTLPPTLESYVGSSNCVLVQDNQGASKGSMDLLVDQEYNQLLNQYYELEEKRKNILQQLQQFGNSNYQYSGEASALGALGESTYSISQEYPIPANQICHQNVVSSCCPHGCPCLFTPCASYPAGEFFADANTAGKPPVEDDVVKTAMEAAEKAMSSLKIDSFANTRVAGENVETQAQQQEMQSRANPGTDLSIVLNAWYAAGLYTAKYLAEESVAKKKHS